MPHESFFRVLKTKLCQLWNFDSKEKRGICFEVLLLKLLTGMVIPVNVMSTINFVKKLFDRRLLRGKSFLKDLSLRKWFCIERKTMAATNALSGRC